MESAAQIQLQAQYELFIDGKWQAPQSKTYFDNVNPADESHLAKIAWANAADVDLAVRAARTAYDNVWSKLSGAERGKYLFRIARLMQEKAKELAILETLDGGKPSASPETSIFRWPAIISFTMLAGPINYKKHSQDSKLPLWAWQGKSHHGIFRS